MKVSNGVEMYEIEVTKMGQNYSFFLTVKPEEVKALELLEER